MLPGKRYTESDFNRIIVIPEREAFRALLDAGMGVDLEKFDLRHGLILSG